MNFKPVIVLALATVAACQSSSDDFRRQMFEEYRAKGDALQREADLHPNDPVAWEALGEARARAQQLEAAMASFRRAIELKTPHERTYSRLAWMLSTLRGCKEGLPVYRAATRAFPASSGAWSDLGAASARCGSADEAQEAFGNSLSAAPCGVGEIQLDKTHASYDAALAARLKTLRNELTKHPGDDITRGHLGCALRLAGQHEEAFVLLSKALEHTSLARLLLPEAVPMGAEAIAAIPPTATAFYRARVLLANDEPEAALKVLNEELATFPYHRAARFYRALTLSVLKRDAEAKRDIALLAGKSAQSGGRER